MKRWFISYWCHDVFNDIFNCLLCARFVPGIHFKFILCLELETPNGCMFSACTSYEKTVYAQMSGIDT